MSHSKLAKYWPKREIKVPYFFPNIMPSVRFIARLLALMTSAVDVPKNIKKSK